MSPVFSNGFEVARSLKRTHDKHDQQPVEAKEEDQPHKPNDLGTTGLANQH